MSAIDFFTVYVKFFFILTPFFIIAVFLSITANESDRIRKVLAGRITMGIVVISLILLLFGDTIFYLFGITVDAFRIGAGALLFLSAVSLTQGRIQLPDPKANILDLAVVPLAIPTALGPGSVGALLVLGSEAHGWFDMALTASAVAAAGLSVGILLYGAHWIRRLIGRSGISMLSKITGLILAALSCQMMFTGIAAFLAPQAG